MPQKARKQTESLRERLQELFEQFQKNRQKEIGEWFGFHAPVHPYDPASIQYDIQNRDAWRFFCLMQMTATELDEYMRMELWNADYKYPAATYGTPLGLKLQAEEFRKRRQQLQVLAQDRAEELDRGDANAYPRWREFYRQVETQFNQQPSPQSEGPVEGTVQESMSSGIRLLWNWQLKVVEVYRKYHEAIRNGRTQI